MGWMVIMIAAPIVIVHLVIQTRRMGALGNPNLQTHSRLCHLGLIIGLGISALKYEVL